MSERACDLGQVTSPCCSSVFLSAKWENGSHAQGVTLREAGVKYSEQGRVAHGFFVILRSEASWVASEVWRVDHAARGCGLHPPGACACPWGVLPSVLALPFLHGSSPPNLFPSHRWLSPQLFLTLSSVCRLPSVSLPSPNPARHRSP